MESQEVATDDDDDEEEEEEDDDDDDDNDDCDGDGDGVELFGIFFQVKNSRNATGVLF